MREKGEFDCAVAGRHVLSSPACFPPDVPQKLCEPADDDSEENALLVVDSACFAFAIVTLSASSNKQRVRSPLECRGDSRMRFRPRMFMMDGVRLESASSDKVVYFVESNLCGSFSNVDYRRSLLKKTRV